MSLQGGDPDGGTAKSETGVEEGDPDEAELDAGVAVGDPDEAEIERGVAPVMDIGSIAKSILSIASKIYEVVQKVKINKKTCKSLQDKVKALEGLALFKTRSYEEDFKFVQYRLRDNMQNLTTALEIKQTHDMVELVKQAFRQRDDEEDRKEDAKELKRMDKPKIIMDIRIIQESELRIPDFPKEGNETDQAPQVYRGEFAGFAVAVKIFASLNVPPEKIKSEFQKEVQTMKQFESPNIVRMFGICILNENTPNPTYLIIMEYCQKGSLQEVLSSRCDLPWTRKVYMCLDAAQGVYRLHQTERRSKLHTNISSSKFLVDHNYGVKLSGLELAQTETSMRKAAVNKCKDKDFISLFYSSPQELNNISHYCRKCEIYSLGIVMWEIATRRMPFSDCHGDKDSLYKKVVADRYREPLPRECPETLEELINSCRAYECIQRPSAGVLVDKLRCLLTELEQ
ncbi:mixed lineage kinase domain-like protein [Fundulus diaphanus]